MKTRTRCRSAPCIHLRTASTLCRREVSRYTCCSCGGKSGGGLAAAASNANQYQSGQYQVLSRTAVLILLSCALAAPQPCQRKHMRLGLRHTWWLQLVLRDSENHVTLNRAVKRSADKTKMVGKMVCDMISHRAHQQHVTSPAPAQRCTDLEGML